MGRIRIRLWYWLLAVAATTVFGKSVAARESRKEPNLATSSLGGNLLGEPTSPPLGGGSQGNQREKGDVSKTAGIDIDYDYFMFGVQKAVSDEEKKQRDQKVDDPQTRGKKNPAEDLPGHSEASKDHDYSYYSYDDDGASHDEYEHAEGAIGHDPFSVFYDSLFPVMDEMEDGPGNDQDKTVFPKASTESPQEQGQFMSTSPAPPSHQKMPSASLKPIQGQRPKHPPPPPLHYRRNNSAPYRHNQRVPRPKPAALKPVPSTKTPNITKPMDLSHLKVLMPKILEKFGLPKSFGEKLFQNEAALQDTILQIMKDKAFRNALGMIPKMDLLNADMTSLLSTLSSLDPTVIMNLLKNADLSKVTSLMSSLGIDTSYISGVFNRAGAAAEYSTKDGGDDDSKLIYIPILDTGSVNNVQVLGFIVILFFLLTTAYAYLEYGAFATARKERPVHQLVTNEQVLGYGDTSEIWLPVVEAIEEETPWNPPPPIHILQPSPTEPPPPAPRPPTLPPRPYTLPPRPPTMPSRRLIVPPRPPTALLPPRQIITAAPKRATLPPPRPRPVYRPIRRRFRPKLRRRYQHQHQQQQQQLQQRYQPTTKNDSPLYLDSQEIRHLTRRRPVYRPRVDRLEPVYYDYYDDYYEDDDKHDSDDYLYEDDYEYYDQGSYRETGEPARSVGGINYKYYPATKRPEDHPYSYYSFPGPRASEGTKKTTTPKSTTTTTTTSTTTTTTTPSTTTTTTPSTRPTSRYADTIRTAQPPFSSLRE